MPWLGFWAEKESNFSGLHVYMFKALFFNSYKDENLLRQSVSEERVSINASLETLEKARSELSRLVDKEFQEAAAEENEEKVI